MSYVVFALKWRPKNFSEIVGQEHIVTTLQNAIQKNRLAHAYLFAGPRGVGKTSTARILAKALNCKDGPTVSPCGKCPSCNEITKGQSLDVIEIDGASNRGIDEIRALRESVKFAPTQGKFKIYIIDEVHQITAEGFNALLKTLEEPPSYVKFIFATTHPHKVIPTILSRCQRLDFRRISLMEIIGQLEKIASAENIKVDKQVLFSIAKSSDGSLRDAESVLDQLIAFSRDKVSVDDVTLMLGLVEQDTLFSITEKIIKKDAAGALALLNSIIDEGKDVEVFLVNLVEHFRNLMVSKVAQADSELIDLPKEMCERLLQQAQSLSLEEIFNAFNILVVTQEMSKRLESVRIPLEISLVRLAHSKKDSPYSPQPIKKEQPYSSSPHRESIEAPAVKSKPVTEISKKQEEPKNTKGSSSAMLIEDAPLAEHNRIDGLGRSVSSIESVSLDSIKESWQNFIKNLTDIKMSVATYLNEGSPLKIQGNLLTIGFPKHCSLHKEALETKDNRLIIEKNISALFNTGLRVNFTLSEEVQPQEKKGISDTFIKSALDMFNGRVIKEG